MADTKLSDLAAATAATGGNLYGIQSGESKKFSLTAAGASLIEAANAAAQQSLLSVPSAANPSASIGLSAVNGVAATFMRSDAAPALEPTLASLIHLNLYYA